MTTKPTAAKQAWTIERMTTIAAPRSTHVVIGTADDAIAVAVGDPTSMFQIGGPYEYTEIAGRNDDGQGHICAGGHWRKGCAFCERDKALAAVKEQDIELSALRAKVERMGAILKRAADSQTTEDGECHECWRTGGPHEADCWVAAAKAEVGKSTEASSTA